ncbi:MAG: sigma-70 family RNA polymerase sigma factor [Phycisphaerae bacterium]
MATQVAEQKKGTKGRKDEGTKGIVNRQSSIVTRRLDKPAPEALPPVSSVLKSLAAEDHVLLERLLSDFPEYIDDGRISKGAADKLLFGVESKLVRKNATRFVRPHPVIGESKSRGSRIPTLSTEQEQLLFLRFNYARREVKRILDAASGKRLTAAQTRKLLAWGHRALVARSEIIRFNLALVLAMAKRTRLNGIDYNELISEGNIALLRSSEKFDCSRGYKFSTYACRAILKSFSRVAMRAGRHRVRFPVEFDPAMEKSDFLERKRIDIEADCVDELKRILVRNTADLNDVEQKVITERFALNCVPQEDPPAPKTLEEVGTLIGVTKERVRQIQNRALRKIRTALETEHLVA